MATRPGVHEIFSNKMLGTSNAFKFEDQESKEKFQLSKKKTMAPNPPMKKFGGYKPRILGGEENFLEVERTMQKNQEALAAAQNQSTPDPEEAPRPAPQLTKPKPWVIGDKNVPMVLSDVNDNDDDDDEDTSDKNNNNVEPPSDSDSHIYSRVIPNEDAITGSRRSTSSDTSTLINPDSEVGSQRGIDNPALQANGSLSDGDSLTNLQFEVVSETPEYAITSGVHNDDGVDQDGEPIGIFIPPPDYDEEEQTLDFNSEDTDEPSDGGEEAKSKSKQIRSKPVMKIYEGADLSQYLSDDDDDDADDMMHVVEMRNAVSKKAKPVNQRPTVSQKHSMFKTTSSKKKGKGKMAAPVFNSVRNFSYADSKYGTKGKAANKSLSYSELNDDSELFLNSNTRHSSYESFLRSRHGETMPAEPAEDEEEELSPGRRDSTVWKKLTLRLKNRVSRGSSLKEH